MIQSTEGFIKLYNWQNKVYGGYKEGLLSRVTAGCYEALVLCKRKNAPQKDLLNEHY